MTTKTRLRRSEYKGKVKWSVQVVDAKSVWITVGWRNDDHGYFDSDTAALEAFRDSKIRAVVTYTELEDDYGER